MLLPTIVGPTAVGKTAVAVRVAKVLDAEIISADSRQIYRGTPVGTGAPTAAELGQARHHLVGTIEPGKRLSAGEYARMAREIAADVVSRGNIPLVVGGSGLYIRALLDGLAPIPKPDPDLRQSIERRIAEWGMEAMIEQLRQVDPEYAAQVGPRDKKRLVRALEVWELTGKPFSAWHKSTSAWHGHPARGNTNIQSSAAVETSSSDTPPYSPPTSQGGKKTGAETRPPVIFGLARPRAELRERISQRVRAMLDGGWLDEIRALADEFGGYDRLPATVLEGLGNREVISLLMGETTRAEAEARIATRHHQLAKRQMTWFRADPRIQWREESGAGAESRWAEWIVSSI